MSAAAALPVAWPVARAAGLVAFGILTLSTWLGLGMSTRLLGPKFQSRLLGWHRTLAWTGLAMVGLHVGALLLDPVMHFGPAAVLDPLHGHTEVAQRTVKVVVAQQFRHSVTDATAAYAVFHGHHELVLAGQAHRQPGASPRSLVAFTGSAPAPSSLPAIRSSVA
jgi:hypothetical protein